MAQEDGGPAFAALATTAMGDVHHQAGMSLRDWLAGHAMAALIASDDAITYQGAAQLAYQHADAMLAYRVVQP